MINNTAETKYVGAEEAKQVRLVGGDTFYTGRVEYLYKEEWGTVCEEGFSPEAARVVCRMLGFTYFKYANTTIRDEKEPGGTGPILVGVNCIGNETDLLDCDNDGWDLSACTHKQDVWITCQTPVRLRDGPTNTIGRVEVFYNGQWGTVCDDNFDEKDAGVFCKMLGYKSKYALANGGARYGPGTGPITIDDMECLGAEQDVADCKSSPWMSNTNCEHKDDASVDCLTDVRLEGGPAAYSGQFQVRDSGQWRSVCPSGIDNKTAQVVCKALGFENGNITLHSRPALAPLLQTGFDCSGNETDIAWCDITELDSSCSQQIAVDINCRSKTAFRLVGGPTATTGKIEPFVNGSWVGVCLDNFTSADAEVLCRMAGVETKNPYFRNANGIYNYPIKHSGSLLGLGCNGTEADISDCRPANPWGTNTCSYTDFAGLTCITPTKVRLAGPSVKAGRVEIEYNNTWLSVCNYSFDSSDAKVICRMLGFNQSNYMLTGNKYQINNPPGYMLGLQCSGNEDHIVDCKAQQWNSQYCDYYKQAEIACESDVRVVNGSDDRSGRVEVLHQGTWGTVCADDFDEDDASVVCRKAGMRLWNVSVLTDSPFGVGETPTIINSVACTGSELDLSSCKSSPWEQTACNGTDVATIDCKIPYTPIKLIQTGVTPYSGVVFAQYNNKWGTICSDGFSKSETAVVCASLGFNFSVDHSFTRTSYGSGCNTLLIKKLKCKGTEPDIAFCQSDEWDSGYSGCSCQSWSNRKAYVNCLSPVSLDYKQTSYTGYARVQRNGRNGAVCADNFTLEDELVLCNMIGYNYSSEHAIKQTPLFKPGSQYQRVVDSLNCNGEEKDYQMCPNGAWKSQICPDSAYVNCHTSARLEEGENAYSGRIEVFFNKSWRPVCFGNDFENRYNAETFCYMMGFGTKKVTVYNVTSTLDVKPLHYSCTGRTNDISQCSGSLVDACDRNMTLAFSCETKVQLSNGKTKYMGAVSVDLWGSNHYITSIKDNITAGVICKMLGLNLTRDSHTLSNQYLRNEKNQSYFTRIAELECDGNETDLALCTNSRMRSSSTSIKTITGISCQTPVKLSNGTNFLHGTVELYNKGWKTICSHGFNSKDAYVFCRMSGHKYSRHAKWTEVLGSTMNVSINAGYLNCTGEEEDISQCIGFGIIDECPNDKIVHIDCRPELRLADGPTPFQGRVEVNLNGKWGPICYDTVYKNKARIICKSLGYSFAGARIMSGSTYTNRTFDKFAITQLNCGGFEETISECASNDWYSANCSNNRTLEVDCYTPSLLVNGANRHIGRVLLQYDDVYQYSYSSICSKGFGPKEADVICRMQGTPTYRNATIYRNGMHGGAGTQVLTNLTCSGDELDIQECTYSVTPYRSVSCDSNETAAVSVNCRSTPVRINGTDTTTGVVEVYYDGSWGPICDSGLHDSDASVLCNMLGFKIGERSTPFRSSSSSNIIRDPQCSGPEKDIAECRAYEGWWWRTSGCNSNYDGRYYYRKANISCSDNRLRLVGGVHKYQGAVKFQYEGRWGSVCDNHFDIADAKVVCRQAGAGNMSKDVTVHRYRKYGTFSRSFTTQDLQCEGSEQDIDECASFPWDSTTTSCFSSNQQFTGVNCIPNTPIRLVNGTNKYSGRVEVQFDGLWGTICDREFDNNDAKVVCRMLGYNTESTGFRQNAFDGEGTGGITISHLQCMGDEPDISECDASESWTKPYIYCEHKNDVSVQCNTPVRIRGGWTRYAGLVEVYLKNEWRQVCLNDVSLTDAETICRISGHNAGDMGMITLHANAFYNEDFKSPTIQSLNCSGNEDDLFECGNGTWVDEFGSTCTSLEAVGLNCRASTNAVLKRHGVNITSLNLPVTGRIEIEYEGTLGTICDDRFDDDNALVLCRMLNSSYSVGLVYNDDRNEEYGIGTGPITIDDLECLGTEQDVSDCKARDWGTHNCMHDEDVVISCDYQHNINPCHPRYHTVLPNLELRFVNVRTLNLEKPINDSRLPLRWYNVGNNTMPKHVPDINRCGTTYPIFMNSTLPARLQTIHHIEAVQFNSSITYDIEMKYCESSIGEPFYVYKLQPATEDSAFCFGIGSEVPPPNFTASQPIVTVDHDSSSLWFMCEFLTSTKANLYYQVQWTIRGNMDRVLTKQYCTNETLQQCFLLDDDIEKLNVGLGIDITCAVRAYNEPDGQPGNQSPMSDAYFAGIKVLSPSVSLQQGSTKSIDIQLTVPIVCSESLTQDCRVTLGYFTPDYNTCGGASLAFPSGCLEFLRNHHYQERFKVNVSSGETGQFGVAGRFSVFLSTSSSRYAKLWGQRYKLPVVDVQLRPESNRQWRGKLCTARNDPHMYTFDGLAYEHHDAEREYVLYRHIKYTNVEIQHKIANCTDANSHAKCNCGLAVRAGRDVYVINVCDRYIDIGYKRCEDEALTVKRDNDFTYTIYLPYGTAVRARIDNEPFMGPEGGKVLDISILPSVQDQEGHSRGLCGTLNGDMSDEYTDRKDNVLANTNSFIKTWSVSANESLFSRNVFEIDLDNWVFPMCSCSPTQSTVTCEQSTKTCTKGTTLGQHSCGGVSNHRSVRSVRHRRSIPTVRLPLIEKPTTRKKRNVDGHPWTNATATAFCKEFFDSSKAFELCKNVPSTHANLSVENCVLDILLTNDIEWIELSHQSMQDTCQTAISRNETVRKNILNETKHNITEGGDGGDLQELEELEEYIKEIRDFCPNNCSQNGVCLSGQCECNQGFGAVDCSLDINKAPTILGLMNNGLCDKNNTDCTHIFAFGYTFAEGNFTCKLQTFQVDKDGTEKDIGVEMTLPGMIETIAESICPIGSTRRKRAAGDAFVSGTRVAVSNNGVYFSESRNLYEFDSTCQTPELINETSKEYNFTLNSLYCYIEKECRENGTYSPSGGFMCVVEKDQYAWTMIEPQNTCDESGKPCDGMNNSICDLNFNGTLECFCLKGFDRNNDDPRNCTEDVNWQNPADVVDEASKDKNARVFNIKAKLSAELDPDSMLNSSQTYSFYEKEIIRELGDYYRRQIGGTFKRLVILNLRKGSLIVEHALITEKDDSIDHLVSKYLLEMSKISFVVNGKDVEVKALAVDGVEVIGDDTNNDYVLCNIYLAVTPCPPDTECRVINGRPACRAIDDSEVTKDGLFEGTSKTVFIVAVSLGGTLLLVVIVLVAVVRYQKKAKKRDQRLSDRVHRKENEYRDFKAMSEPSTSNADAASDTYKLPRVNLDMKDYQIYTGKSTRGARMYDYLPGEEPSSYSNGGYQH